MHPMFGLTKSQHGYQLRLGVPPAKKTGFYFTMNFSLSKYGTYPAALKTALQKRAEIVASEEYIIWSTRKSRNGSPRTGFIEVYASCGKDTRSGRLWANFQVKNCENSRSFSCVKRGVFEAYKLAAKHSSKNNQLEITDDLIDQRYEIFLKCWGERFRNVGLDTSKEI